jgi:predicted aspartyl protease
VVDLYSFGRVKSVVIMFDYPSLRTVSYFISISLAFLVVACHQDKQAQINQANGEIPSPVVSSSVRAESTSQVGTPTMNSSSSVPKSTKNGANKNEVKFFERGLDKAAGAFSISQSAQSISDWNLVANQYQDAIALMKLIQRGNPYFDIAQSKIGEYRRQVESAQLQTATNRQELPQPEPQQVVIVAVPQPTVTPQSPKNPQAGISQIAPRPKSPVAVAVPVPKVKQVQRQIVPVYVSPEPISESIQAHLLAQQGKEEVVSVPIKRRMGGTPIIEVTFNGNQAFEMIVDTGASGTVITQNMANLLGVISVGKAKANTASSKSVTFPIGYVSSMEVRGVKVNRTAVAIAGGELETGLLGHDFFGNYDITIKRDVVEFRPHVNTSINPTENRPSIPIYPKK